MTQSASPVVAQEIAPDAIKIAIDPITRIEGHLRIEAQIAGGKVVDAWSAGMMFRGIELILPGRDPRDAWAFTQRICGV
jgi:Ni,Fe-hydrogenase I large subunit